jgi:hypothetical protein
MQATNKEKFSFRKYLLIIIESNKEFVQDVEAQLQEVRPQPRPQGWLRWALSWII